MGLKTNKEIFKEFDKEFKDILFHKDEDKRIKDFFRQIINKIKKNHKVELGTIVVCLGRDSISKEEILNYIKDNYLWKTSNK